MGRGYVWQGVSEGGRRGSRQYAFQCAKHTARSLEACFPYLISASKSQSFFKIIRSNYKIGLWVVALKIGLLGTSSRW